MNVGPLDFEIVDGIARLTLNRPAAANSVDSSLNRALADASAACANDTRVRCVLITGTGRFFCSGGNVDDFRNAGVEISDYLAREMPITNRWIAELMHMAKPVVIAVNGPAAGVGLGLAMTGDIVLAARSAHFTAAATALGLTPDGGMTWTLPRLIGTRRAQEMLLTNRRVPAEEAEAIGLVTRVLDDGELEPEALAVARRLADGATAALASTRRLILEGGSLRFDQQLERELQSMVRAGGGPESREGFAAFLGKRKPDFRGS